jgi:hypothetical protein
MTGFLGTRLPLHDLLVSSNEGKVVCPCTSRLYKSIQRRSDVTVITGSPGDHYHRKYQDEMRKTNQLMAAIRVIRVEAARQTTEAERTILQVCNRVLKRVR